MLLPSFPARSPERHRRPDFIPDQPAIPEASSPGEETTANSEQWDRGPSAGSSGSEKMSRVDPRLDLAQVLQMLDEDHRQVIVLRELHQMSYAEIAEELGVPQGTVESRLHRARKQLRLKLGEYLTE